MIRYFFPHTSFNICPEDPPRAPSGSNIRLQCSITKAPQRAVSSQTNKTANRKYIYFTPWIVISFQIQDTRLLSCEKETIKQ